MFLPTLRHCAVREEPSGFTLSRVSSGSSGEYTRLPARMIGVVLGIGYCAHLREPQLGV